MLLAIDAGNSHLVLGCFTRDALGQYDRKPVATWRLSTHPIGTADELRIRVWTLLNADGYPLDDFEAIVLSSVVPALTEIAREAFPHLHVIDCEWPFSYKIGTDNPWQTGADRLVNAEAVLREYGAPAIIVDSGTATTICALSQDRVFMGGAILPGIEACRDTLPAKAAQLFLVPLDAPQSVIGRDTDSALRSGVVLGYASMLDGMIRRFKSELGQNTNVVSTGGTSRLLKNLCTELGTCDPDLTLKGILYLYESLRHR